MCYTPRVGDTNLMGVRLEFSRFKHCLERDMVQLGATMLSPHYPRKKKGPSLHKYKARHITKKHEGSLTLIHYRANRKRLFSTAKNSAQRPPGSCKVSRCSSIANGEWKRNGTYYNEGLGFRV